MLGWKPCSTSRHLYKTSTRSTRIRNVWDMLDPESEIELETVVKIARTLNSCGIQARLRLVFHILAVLDFTRLVSQQLYRDRNWIFSISWMPISFFPQENANLPLLLQMANFRRKRLIRFWWGTNLPTTNRTWPSCLSPRLIPPSTYILRKLP